MKHIGFYVTLLICLGVSDALAQFEGNTLSEAVDNTEFNFQSGNPGFIRQSGVSNFGGDAAASQNISDNQTAIMLTQFVDTIGQGGTVTFDWKVSSESSADILAFIIVDSSENVIRQREISGERDWTRVAVDIPVGNYTLAWGYVKDGSLSIGRDTGYVDRVRISRTGEDLPPECRTNPSPLRSALDNDELGFTDFFGSVSKAEFDCQSEVFTTGGAAAKSRPTVRYGTSQMFTTVTGPIDLVFDWRIDAGPEDIFQVDMFKTQIDFDKSIQIFGITEWQTYRLRVPRGQHKVRWVYRRFSIDPIGDDAGYVDNVRSEEATLDPRIKGILPSLFLNLLLDDAS